MRTEPLPLARDIMVRKLVTVSPGDSVRSGALLLRRHGISGVPVMAPDGSFLGVFSERCCIRFLSPLVEALGGAATAKRAGAFMAAKVMTLRPGMDAIEALSLLLQHRFSGAPVVDDGGRFLGVFSERYVMRLLVHSAYESAPTAVVGALMNTDPGRLIEESAELSKVARLFLDFYYRRLPVVRDGVVVGQVSHRDVMAAASAAAGVGDDAAVVGAMETARVGDQMETGVETVEEETDFLAIAQLFLHSNRRRLPVLDRGRVVGQISRRDLLRSALDLLAPAPGRTQSGLYLSAVMEPNQRPLLNRADYAASGLLRSRERTLTR